MNKANNPSLKYYLGHFIIVDDSIQPIQPALLQHALNNFWTKNYVETDRKFHQLNKILTYLDKQSFELHIFQSSVYRNFNKSLLNKNKEKTTIFVQMKLSPLFLNAWSFMIRQNSL